MDHQVVNNKVISAQTNLALVKHNLTREQKTEHVTVSIFSVAVYAYSDRKY